MKRKILLTGATSFLGKRIRHVLSEHEYQIIGTSKHGEENIVGMDLSDVTQVQDFINDTSYDVIIHAGAFVNLSRDYDIGKECFDVNTIGTMHLLETIKEKKPSLFMYISSEEVYGNGPLPFKEEQRVDPPSPYAISKVAAEQLCQWYGREYDFPVVILRLGTFYGPEQPDQKYFAQTILHALKNEPIPCNSGIKKRDYIYVDDAVELIKNVIEQDEGRTIRYIPSHEQVINGTGGKSYQLLEVIEVIKKLTGSTSVVQIGAIPDRITERDEWLADITKAKELFGWEPRTGLEEGLNKIIEYFRDMI